MFLLKLDQSLPGLAPFDERRDGAELEVVASGHLDQFRQAGHRSVFAENFAGGPGGFQSGEAGEVDSCLGVTRTAENSPGLPRSGKM